MAVKVRIPTPLQALTNNQPEVSIEGATVGELIEKLNAEYPGLKERVCDESGKVRRFINIFVNEQDIRFLKKEDTSVKEGDEVSIVPAIAGG
jgi:molybdopterin synthase sulfur carrier subunit